MHQAVKDLKLYLRVLKSDEEGYRVNLIPSGNRTGAHKPFDRSAEEILDERQNYFRGNSVGMRDVYCRAYNQHFVMVDDITTTHLAAVYEYDPCLIVETSKDNHQVWYKCDQIESREDQLNIGRWFADVLGGDRQATATMQLSRLPGFMNRKPGRNKHMIKVVRDRRYVPGQYASIPDAAFHYTLHKATKKRRVHYEDDADADDESTQSQRPHKRRQNNDTPASQGSVVEMTQSQRDNSSSDWAFVLTMLEDSVGRISDTALRKALAQRTQKKNARTTEYVPNTCRRARAFYEEKNPFWRAM